jgi:hypothetical protein
MPRPSIGETPMTGAERQARYRTAHASGAPVIRIRRPADRRSRIQRLAGCEFQAPQKCLRLIKVYAINFIP